MLCANMASKRKMKAISSACVISTSWCRYALQCSTVQNYGLYLSHKRSYKFLEAAHHKFQRRILGISWRDKVRNEEVREKTTLQTLDLTIKERRLRWLGHVLRMGSSRLPKQSIYWEANNTNWRLGRLRKSWLDIIRRDLKEIGLSWEEHSSAALTEKIGVDVWPHVS